MPEPTSPRLAPRYGSWNPLVWLAMLAYRFAVGRVSVPVRVIFARAPRTVPAHLLLVSTAEYGLSLDNRLKSLVRVFGSRVNGCMFCDDIETHVALEAGHITREDLEALADYAASERFNERERAALAYVEDINRNRTASEDSFEALRSRFEEREIIEITWLNAVGNYLNLQARPLGIGSEGYCRLPTPANAARPQPGAQPDPRSPSA